VKITVHQALCGEKNKAWDLLKTTLPDLSEAKSIAYKSDLHDTANGVPWTSSIRGFALPQYYLIMRSFLEPPGEVRPGRAFSHVLIVAKDQLSAVANLQPLIDLLPERIDKEGEIKPIQLDSKLLIANSTITDNPNPFLGRFKKVINGYTQFANYDNTIVWVGENDYEMAVNELWQRLTEAERNNFNFGIYFNANAIPKDKLNFVLIPERNVTKFQHSGYLIVNPSDNMKLTSFSEEVLLGNKDTHAKLDAFAKAIGQDEFPRAAWDTVSIGLKTYENLDAEQDLKKINTLANIVAAYSSAPTKGAALKTQILTKLSTLVEKASVTELPLLANFKIDSFAKSKTLLGNAVQKWMGSHLFQVDKTQPGDLEIVDTAEKLSKKNWLAVSVVEAIERFLTKGESKAYTKFFEWLELKPNLLGIFKTSLTSDKESVIIGALPTNLSIGLANKLLDFAKAEKWYKLYAHLNLRATPFIQAVQMQLDLGNDAANNHALQQLVKGKTDKEIVQLALSITDDRTYIMAGNVCRANPKLLNDIDLASKNWQVIWARAVNSGLAIDQGFKKFKDIAFGVFDRLVQNEYVRPELVAAISRSKYANLLSYPHRAQLWPKLDGPIRTQFLKETSSVLLEELSQGKTANVPDDTVLSNYVFQSAINDFLYYNRQKIKPVLPIFKRFSTIPNGYLHGYLKNFHGGLDSGEAKNLGKLIAQRRAEDSAHLVFQRSSKSNSWSIALKECYDLLGFFDKAAMYVGEIVSKITMSSDSWWYHIEETLCNYYANPNAVTTIWRKAGGAESELLLGVPAQQTWANAISRLKRKDFKKITMNSLLQEVKKDYGDVPAFKMLFKMRKSHIKT
jgi:hypothetical protein